MKPHLPCVLTALLVAATAGMGVPDDASMPGTVYNIVTWDGGALPPRVERTDQAPLTREELVRLSTNGFAPGQIVRILQERRFAGDATAAGMIALKNSGVAAEVLQAVSLHALPPNRSLNLAVELLFEGGVHPTIPEGSLSDRRADRVRNRYLYVIIPDRNRERVFVGDLNAVLSGRWRNDVVIDDTDPLLPRRIRRVTFSGEIPLRTYGPKRVLVLTSSRPDILTSADIPPSDRGAIKAFDIDYPPSSARRECLVQVRYRQDDALPSMWHMVRSDLVCEWD